jgi:molecular chaperone DnaK (HSP70)
MVKMIGLDLGASGWRAGYISEAGAFIPLEHRFASKRRPPYVSSSVVPGKSDIVIFCDDVKRFLGNREAHAFTGNLSPNEELPRQLADIFDDIAAKLETKCLGAVIPLPSCFHERERAEVAEAAKRAGFEVVQVPEESTMVVNGVPALKQNTGPVLYFHLGASTLNLSIFIKDDSNGYYFERCYEGSAFRGGDNFDAHVMHWVLQQAKRRMKLNTAWLLRDFINEDLRQKCEQMRWQIHTANPATISSISVGHFVATSGEKMEPSNAIVEMTLDDFQIIAAPLLKDIGDRFERLMNEATKKGVQPDQIKTALIAGGAAINMPYIWQNLFSKYGINANVESVDSEHVVVQEAARYALKLLPELQEVEKNLPAGQVLPRRNITPLKPKEEPAPARKRPAHRAAPAASQEQESRGSWARHAEAIALAEQDYKERRPDKAIQALYNTAMELLHLAQELTERNRESDERVFRLQTIRSVANILSTSNFLACPDILMTLAYYYLSVNDFDHAGYILETVENAIKRELKKYEEGEKLRPEERDEIIKSLHAMEIVHHDSEIELHYQKFVRYCELAHKMYDDVEKNRYCKDAVEQLEKAINKLQKAINSSKSAGNENRTRELTSWHKELQEKLKICHKEREKSQKAQIRAKNTSEVEK